MSEMGHNSDGRLKAFVERIEKLREERKALKEDEADVMKEATSAGYDKPALTELLKERAIDAAKQKKLDERDAILAVYRAALGG